MKNSKIEWTGSTWNPWRGCDAVSPGCDHCYAADRARWVGEIFYGNVQRSKTTFNDPLKWKVPELIFTCSLGDFFHRAADQWRAEAWDIIRRTPHHRYQILTKRAGLIQSRLPEDWESGAFGHVWLGTSVESDREVHRLNKLLTVPQGGAGFFVSCEPLLGYLNIEFWLEPERWGRPLDWVIVGGESGAGAREMHPEWALSLINQCDHHHVPIMVKQLGAVMGKRLGCNDKKGCDVLAWPADLVRQESPEWFPEQAMLDEHEANVDAASY